MKSGSLRRGGGLGDAGAGEGHDRRVDDAAQVVEQAAREAGVALDVDVVELAADRLVAAADLDLVGAAGVDGVAVVGLDPLAPLAARVAGAELEGVHLPGDADEVEALGRGDRVAAVEDRALGAVAAVARGPLEGARRGRAQLRRGRHGLGEVDGGRAVRLGRERRCDRPDEGAGGGERKQKREAAERHESVSRSLQTRKHGPRPQVPDRW